MLYVLTVYLLLSYTFVPAGTGKDLIHHLVGPPPAPATSTACCIPPSRATAGLQRWAPRFSATSALGTCFEVTITWTALSDGAEPATAASPTSAVTNPRRKWRVRPSAAPPLQASTRALLTTIIIIIMAASPWTRRPSHRSARDERRPARSSLYHQSPAPPCKNIVSPCLLLPLAATVSVC